MLSASRTKDDVLALLIHLGYLGYDIEKKETFIPNKEVAGEFENAMSVGGWPEIMGQTDSPVGGIFCKKDRAG